MVDLAQTPRQRDVLFCIAQLESERIPVTTTRIADDLKLPRQNVRTYLLGLRDKGYVLYDAEKRQRAMILLTETGRALTSHRFPVIGTVAAGQPILAEQHLERTVASLQDVLDLKEGDFFLRVKGDSMCGAGIFDDDLVAIRPSRVEPQSGEIALVLLPGEGTATLKRWSRQEGLVSLHSENPAYQPLVLPAQDVEVQGKLVGHIGTGRVRRTTPSFDSPKRST